MKISEITDKNIVWNSLNNLNIDDIVTQYNLVKDVFEMIIRMKRKHLMPSLKSMIEDLAADINRYISSKHPDQNDPDILEHKRMLTIYRNNMVEWYRQLE